MKETFTQLFELANDSQEQARAAAANGTKEYNPDVVHYSYYQIPNAVSKAFLAKYAFTQDTQDLLAVFMMNSVLPFCDEVTANLLPVSTVTVPYVCVVEAN